MNITHSDAHLILTIVAFYFVNSLLWNLVLAWSCKKKKKSKHSITTECTSSSLEFQHILPPPKHTRARTHTHHLQPPSSSSTLSYVKQAAQTFCCTRERQRWWLEGKKACHNTGSTDRKSSHLYQRAHWCFYNQRWRGETGREQMKAARCVPPFHCQSHCDQIRTNW